VNFSSGILRFAGMAVFLISGLAQAQAEDFDESRNYICEGCTDRSSARQFVEERVVNQGCNTAPFDPHWSASGDACAGPDERAVVIHPETLEVFTFIVYRGSMARENLPPMVVQAEGAISDDEIAELQAAWEIYLDYEAFVADVAAYHQSLIEANISTGSFGVQSDDDFAPDIDCPSGTALEVLGDQSEFVETRQAVIDWAKEEFGDRFDDETRLHFSSASVAINAGFLSGQANFEAGSSGYSMAEGYRTTFSIVEAETDGRRNWESIDGAPDYLWFDFTVARAQDGYVSAFTEINPQMSRVHGHEGWLTDDHDLTELDDCTRHQLTNAYSNGIVDNPNASGGASGGGMVGGTGGGGGDTYEMICVENPEGGGGPECCAGTFCIPAQCSGGHCWPRDPE